jgi:TRAP transporter TAXI family solute receptor
MAKHGNRRHGLIHIPRRISRISWRDLAVSIGPILVITAAAVWIAFRFVQPAPPSTITITSGPEGSSFQRYADRYAKILKKNGIELKVLPSRGALDNLQRLKDPDFEVDVGFVQGGLFANIETPANLVSLGSVFYEPVAVFYRSTEPIARLAQLKGRRIAVGAEGSGARSLALTLLNANGVEAAHGTKILNIGGAEAVQALLTGKIDAAFVMGDSATAEALKKLMAARDIRLYDFTQADAYVRRFRFLSKLELPAGSINLGRNLPDKPLTLIAPTAELVAREGLHPALSDLLIEAAREVHGRGGLLQEAGEFPSPREHEYRISDDAARYYKSGKSFLYRYLPFWLASLADRMWVLLVPLLVLLIPGLRLVPMVYSWRIRQRIYRRYGELMALERATLEVTTPEQREEMLKRIDDIEKSVISVKIPGAFADELYVLRLHIHFVRNRLTGTAAAVDTPASGAVTAGQ